MKKMIHSIFCYKTLLVTDADTGKKEKATYSLLFGLTIRVIYQ